MRQNTPNIPPIAPVSALRLSYQPQNIDRIDLALNLFQQPASLTESESSRRLPLRIGYLPRFTRR